MSRRTSNGFTAAIVGVVLMANSASASAQMRAPRDSVPDGFNNKLASVSRLFEKAASTTFGALPALHDEVIPRLKDLPAKAFEQYDEKLAPWMKRFFKDFRPGSCKTISHGAPNTSWRTFSEPAVTFCQS